MRYYRGPTKAEKAGGRLLVNLCFPVVSVWASFGRLVGTVALHEAYGGEYACH